MNSFNLLLSGILMYESFTLSKNKLGCRSHLPANGAGYDTAFSPDYS